MYRELRRRGNSVHLTVMVGRGTAAPLLKNRLMYSCGSVCELTSEHWFESERSGAPATNQRRTRLTCHRWCCVDTTPARPGNPAATNKHVPSCACVWRRLCATCSRLAAAPLLDLALADKHDCRVAAVRVLSRADEPGSHRWTVRSHSGIMPAR